MLLGFFERYFTKPEPELVEFIGNLERFELPFENLLEQLRQIERPGYPTFECGLPPDIYYYIPNTRWGSDKPIPTAALSPEFVYAVDGTGLNFGCPLRLHRALKLLSSLPDNETSECRRNLAEPMQHLSSVEELLWLEIWNPPYEMNRSEGTPNKTHDWKVKLPSLELRLECKFRPSDWVRNVDGENLQFFDGFLLKKASRQLPLKDDHSINIAAITGINGTTIEFKNMIADELSTYPNIEALIYRSLANELCIFSLKEGLPQKIAALIGPQPTSPLYSIIKNISACIQREEASQNAPSKAKKMLPYLFEQQIPNLPPPIKFRLPEKPYRFKLIKRKLTGEPVFEAITPLISKKV